MINKLQFINPQKMIVVVFSYLYLSVEASDLQNVTCGCIQYDGNPEIRCYTPPTTCADRYLGSGVYASHIPLNTVVQALFANDFALQSLITSLNTGTQQPAQSQLKEMIDQMKPFVYVSFALNLLMVALLIIYAVYKCRFQKKEQPIEQEPQKRKNRVGRTEITTIWPIQDTMEAAR